MSLNTENSNGTLTKENRLGNEKVLRLVFSMSLPMMFAMLVQSLYNIVDSIFVSRISEDALTSVSLAFPVQSLMIAVGVGTAVGINAFLSRALGAKLQNKVNAIASMSLILATLSSIIFMLIFGIGAEAFYKIQSSNENIVSMGTAYLQVVSYACIGFFIQVSCEKLLSATGRTVLSMLTQLSGAVINIILDPIFIFGYLGVPKMGVAGAAVATVIGQFVAAIFGLYLNIRHNPDIRINILEFWKTTLRFKLHLTKEIYEIALPSILMAGIGSVMTYAMNQILLVYSSTAAAIFGVYFRLQSFVFMPIFGLNYGIIPIISFNYGANNKGRIKEVVKIGMITAVSYSVLGFICFNIFPKDLLLIFDANPNMLSIGIPALKIISVSFILAGFSIISIATTQALNKSIYALWVSILRQLVALLPLAYIFSRVGGLELIWWSFPAAEIVSFACALFFLRRSIKTRFAEIEANNLKSLQENKDRSIAYE